MSVEKSPPVRKWTIEIPDWFPVSVNETRNQHWRKEYKLKRAASDILRVYAAIAGVKFVGDGYAPKRRVEVHVEYPSSHTQLPDPSNLTKILYDALKLAGVIFNDNSTYLDGVMPTVCRGGLKGKTVISVKDI